MPLIVKTDRLKLTAGLFAHFKRGREAATAYCGLLNEQMPGVDWCLEPFHSKYPPRPYRELSWVRNYRPDVIAPFVGLGLDRKQAKTTLEDFYDEFYRDFQGEGAAGICVGQGIPRTEHQRHSATVGASA